MITLVFLVITAIISIFYNYLLNRPELASPLFRQYVLFTLLFFGSVVVVRGLSYLLIDILFTRLTHKAPSELLRLVVGVTGFGIALILNLRFILNANVAAILATSALVTAILGFALQATLGNLFEGLSVQIHQPFNIGDWLEFGDTFGRIESLTWRAVAMRQYDNTIISIPNNILAQSAIRVFHTGEPYRLSVKFPTPIDVPPHQVTELVTEAVTDVAGVLPQRRPEVLLDKIASQDSALHYELRFYTHVDEEIDRIQARVRERVWYTLARAGIPMPTPIEGQVSAFKVPLLRPLQETLLPQKTIINALAANPLFIDLPESIYPRLAGNAIRLIFSPGELIRREGLARYSMYIVLRGLVSTPLTTEEWADDFHNGVLESYWEPELLNTIRHQFAEYVGPVSGYLIKKAAEQTIDPYHLYRLLAQDIPNAAERETFLGLGPASPVKEIPAGEFFGEMSLFTGQHPTGAPPKAVNETELLEIRASNLQQVFANNPELVPVMSRRLATYHNLPPERIAGLTHQIREFYHLV